VTKRPVLPAFFCAFEAAKQIIGLRPAHSGAPSAVLKQQNFFGSFFKKQPLSYRRL
jgi:hypothetical protein